MPIIYLGFGSNLGDRRHNIEQALKMLPEYGIAPRKCSTIIETAPVGGPPQGPYLNGVLQADTNLSPTALLTRLKHIEQRLGRTFTGRNGPRVIDLDILLYDDMVVEEEGLVIPHPRMTLREFVMLPLTEIAPELVEKIRNAAN